MKKYLIIPLTLLALVACSDKKSNSPANGSTAPSSASFNRDPYTLIQSMVSEPETLNLLTAAESYASTINSFLFDSLIERDNKTLEFKPKIAEKWEMSPDQMTFTFTLRDGVTWHDGKPLTVDDVVYSFQQIMNPKVAAPQLRNYYQDIAKCEKIDNKTVRFVYSKPYFKALEFVGGIPIIPKHIFDDGTDFNQHPAGRKPIGNGPYKFSTWDTGKQIVLERNENYWDKSRFPEIKKIIFKIVPDQTIAFQALRRGDLDMGSLQPIEWVKKTEDAKFNDQFVKHQYYLPKYRYVGWNLTKPYFRDKKVRQALTRLINRKMVVDKIEYGFGKLTESPFWVLSDVYNKNLAHIPYDIEGAKKLLEEAGWVDQDGDGIREKEENGQKIKFEFTFLIPSGMDFYERLATIMKEDFAKAGIQVNIRTMEWAVFTRKVDERDFDAVCLGWTGSFEEDPYQIWHSSQVEKGSNFIGFKNAEADQIMEEARRTFDKDKRKQLYDRLQEIIYDEQPYSFLYTNAVLVARHRRFQNVEVYRGGLDILEWKIAP